MKRRAQEELNFWLQTAVFTAVIAAVVTYSPFLNRAPGKTQNHSTTAACGTSLAAIPGIIPAEEATPAE